MRIEIKTAPYNQRRYGKPWIAKVNFASNPRGLYQWGDWISDQPGDAGLLVLDVQPGDIVAHGHKDHRGNGTYCRWAVIMSDGSRYRFENKAAAYSLSSLAPSLRALKADAMHQADITTEAAHA